MDFQDTGEALASALKREHSALQNMKFLDFFLLLWVILVLLDPDPLTWLDPDPLTWLDPEPLTWLNPNPDLIMLMEPDPDPKHRE